MADTLYSNPTSIRPEIGWKPSGFLAGMNYSSDRQRYEDTASLQDYMMMNQASKSGMELKDYMSDAPVREAKRLSDIATSRANAETIGGIKQNELKKGTLDNDLAEGVLKSKISQAISEAAIKGGEASLAELQKAGAVASALSKAAGSGPQALALTLQHLKQSGASPQIMNFFSGARDVKQLKAMADAVTEGLLDANVSYQQHMRGIKEQGRNSLAVAGVHAQSALDVARERSKVKDKSASQVLDSLAGKSPENQLPFLYSIIQDPDVNPELKGKAQRMYEQARAIVQAKQKPRPGAIPGLPADTVPSIDPTQGGGGGGLPPGVQRLP